jgi:energy-coupling factor transporter transmembrane protein EcfT
VIAAATVVAAILINNVLCLVLLGIVAVVVPAATSRTLRTVSRSTLLLSLPLAVSAVVINVLFSDSDQSIVVQLGPLSVTEAGVALALEVLARILVMAGAGGVF